MSALLLQILDLIERREAVISDHGYDELAADGILVKEAYAGARSAVMVEEYPNYRKGPCVLVLQQDSKGEPVHVLWGIPAGAFSPAVLITAYRPDVDRWTGDFLKRKP